MTGKKFTSSFALKATIAVAIVLALLMTYSIFLKSKPAGFSLLYFDQAEYAKGSFVATIENRENADMNYTLRFSVDGRNAGELSVLLEAGQNASYPVIDYAPAFAIPNSTVEVRALRQAKEPLAIYATNRVAEQKG